MEVIVFYYQYIVFFYSIVITLSYLTLAILGYFNMSKKQKLYTDDEHLLLEDLPEVAPGISVVTPAYNEEVIVTDSVHSFLGLEYPNFEVIIVNDGSTDKTLEVLIDEFELEEIGYPYVEKVYCQPVKRIFKSTNPEYKRLMVVDKENGGTKADAMNAGLNVAKHKYFINTDIDGLLHPKTLSRVIVPVLDSDADVRVIAVGSTMRMVNNCDVKKGRITRVRPPKRLYPIFQEIEYLRSYIVAKMGWSVLNAIPNVSGGFGLFDTEVSIGAGGYDSISQAEDMDMTLRMIAYMRNNKKKYLIRQIPDTCCWTEGPPNLSVFFRQRTRWGRGILQTFIVHRGFLFNPRYGKMGLLVLPYSLFFEFFAPIITVVGFFFLGYLLLGNNVNFGTFWLLLFFVYLIGVSISWFAIAADLANRKLYKSYWEYGRLVFFSLFEIILYQPVNMVCFVIGYIQFLYRRDFKWKSMTRQGYTKETE